MTADWKILPDAESVAQAVATAIKAEAEQSIQERGAFKIVLAGGTTPARIYQLLAQTSSDWSAWQIYFGDERCVPNNDPERNSVMAAVSWLDQVAIPKQNIHAIPAESGAEQGAQDYASIVQQAQPFDLVLLGMGEDGHTASLFPGHTHDSSELVHAVHNAPKPPPDRISLGLAAINSANEVFIIVTGKGKRDAVQQWRQGEALPIAQVHGKTATRIYIDEAASGS